MSGSCLVILVVYSNSNARTISVCPFCTLCSPAHRLNLELISQTASSISLSRYFLVLFAGSRTRIFGLFSGQAGVCSTAAVLILGGKFLRTSAFRKKPNSIDEKVNTSNATVTLSMLINSICRLQDAKARSDL